MESNAQAATRCQPRALGLPAGQHQSAQVHSLLAFLGREFLKGPRGHRALAGCYASPKQQLQAGPKPRHRVRMTSTEFGSLLSFKILLPAFWFKTELKEKKTMETKADGCGSGGEF